MTYSSDIAQRLYGINDYNEWIDQAALSITNDIRLRGSSSSENQTYAGTTLFTRPFVKVRWAWLTFPAVLVSGSVLFLALNIVQSRFDNVQAWKSSVLAMLFCTMDDDIAIYAAEKWKAEERVFLQSSKEGGHFVRAETTGEEVELS